MLNEKKIEIMTQLAKFEQDEGNKMIKIGKYYKSDYVRYNLLKTVLGMTIGYIIILIMTILYKAEYLIEHAVDFDYKGVGTNILLIYIMLLIIYVAISILWYSFKYDSSRKKLGQYLKNLKKLSGFYKDETQQK
jgi:type III secretory pathway component EscU